MEILKLWIVICLCAITFIVCVLILTLGPIIMMMNLGIMPFPYGLPIYVVYGGVVVGTIITLVIVSKESGEKRTDL